MGLISLNNCPLNEPEKKNNIEKITLLLEIFTKKVV